MKMSAGREEELSYMQKKRVWTPVLRTSVLEKSSRAPIVGVRWVDVEKGETVRCRLCAKEYATDKRDDLFAGTLPFSGMRYVISDAMGRGRRSKF